MTTRNRSNNSDLTVGSIRQYVNGNLSTQNNTSRYLLQESCSDVADTPHYDHPFNLTRVDQSGLNPASGARTTGPYAGSGFYNHYPRSDLSFDALHVDASANPVTANDFAALRARTSPSRPVVVPLTLLQDLVDIPRQLKDVGRLLKRGHKGLSAKDIANQNLGAQFGWLPLIDDAKKLIDFQLHVAKRSLEIQRLYSSEGLKRRIRLSETSYDSSYSNKLVESTSVAGFVYLNASRRQVVTKWGTIRWKPTSVPGVREADVRSIRSIQRVVGGLTPEGLFQGAWDLIPWTWVVDWFVDVGSYIGSNSNFIPATSAHENVMRQVVTTNAISRGPSTSAWISYEPGSSIVTTKQRVVGGSPILISMPFIGIRRLSILASLFIQRFK